MGDVIRSLSAALVAAALLFGALPARADSITLSCSGSETTTRTLRDGSVGEAEQKDVKDFSIVVDLDHGTVSGFWPELKLDPVYTPIPITAVDANIVRFGTSRNIPLGINDIFGSIDRTTGMVSATDFIDREGGGSLSESWDLLCKPTKASF